MRFATLNRLPLSELRAMSLGRIPDTITDMDFLETLAAHRCIVVPPFVLQTTRTGGLRRMVPLVYTVDGELDNARILVLLARKLRQESGAGRFRGRLSL